MSRNSAISGTSRRARYTRGISQSLPTSVEVISAAPFTTVAQPYEFDNPGLLHALGKSDSIDDVRRGVNDSQADHRKSDGRFLIRALSPSPEEEGVTPAAPVRVELVVQQLDVLAPERVLQNERIC